MGYFGQFASASQFYLFGRRHFTRTGWEMHRTAYASPDLLTQNLDLSGRVYLITGGNAGVGREVAQFLASKGAAVHLVCRSRERAEAARAEMVAATGNQAIYVLQGDVGVEEDVRRCWREFVEQSGSPMPRLDGLVCNAGALSHEKTLTKEGVEVTFASHLLFGTYLLGKLAMPALKASKDARLIAVSSGGMYTTPFPAWEVATATSPDAKYDGQLAYAYAKRGQVLLCERWASEVADSGVKVVSCHPGWSSTLAVERAYADTKQYLEPMRTPWEGAEGIAWLCVAPSEQLESGAFYLDRAPQVKHVAGPFFSEGTYTKNTTEEVDAMMRHLDDWADGNGTADLLEQAELRDASAAARASPLAETASPLDLPRFMGRWYVILNIPTFLDRDTVNNVEDYVLDEASRTVDVDFTYSDRKQAKTSVLKQRAKVENDLNTRWSISPKFGVYLPVRIPYLVADCAEDYSSTIIGVPDRSYVWVMTRTPTPDPSVVKALTKKVQALGYDVRKLVRVPQNWGAQGSEACPPHAQGA